MWCRPRSPVEPMYMPGRLRTASSPSRTVMELPEYVFSVFGRATTWGPSVAQPAHDEPPRTTGAQGRRTALSRLLAVSDLQSTRPYDRNGAVHALRSCLRHAGLVGHQRCCLPGRHAVPGSLGRSGSTDRAVPAIRCSSAREQDGDVDDEADTRTMAEADVPSSTTCLVTGATGYIGGGVGAGGPFARPPGRGGARRP